MLRKRQTEELEAGEVFTVVIKCYADKVFGKEQILKIRVVDETSVPAVTCTLKGAIDLSKEDSGTILITPKYKNYIYSSAVGTKPKANATASVSVKINTVK